MQWLRYLCGILCDMDLEKAFWKIHENLPRQAPGSDNTTRHLLQLAGGAERFNNALDIGCGPGRSSLVLGEEGINVTAIDTADTYLTQLKSAAEQQGLTDRIETSNMAMENLSFNDGEFDLIWSEGSIYIIGWEAGLKAWRKLIRESGRMVVTECCWLTDEPTNTASNFWREAYPAMLTIDEASLIAERCGYRLDHTYVLPEHDWWDEYYNPLKARHELLSKTADKPMKVALAISESEIALRREHGNEYGYIGFVLST